MIKGHPKASIPTLKPSTTQEPISSRARHTMQILQQCMNITLSFNIQAAQSHTKHTGISKLLNTSLHSRDKKSSSTHRNTDASFLNKETLRSNPSNATTVWNLHNKEEPQNARLQKGHPKHSNINKMKRQRNTQQVKEHDKCPSNQTKEEETGNLPDKEF